MEREKDMEILRQGKRDSMSVCVRVHEKERKIEIIGRVIVYIRCKRRQESKRRCTAMT